MYPPQMQQLSSLKLLQQTSKPCPGCKFATQKTEGCNKVCGAGQHVCRCSPEQLNCFAGLSESSIAQTAAGWTRLLLSVGGCLVVTLHGLLAAGAPGPPLIPAFRPLYHLHAHPHSPFHTTDDVCLLRLLLVLALRGGPPAHVPAVRKGHAWHSMARMSRFAQLFLLWPPALFGVVGLRLRYHTVPIGMQVPAAAQLQLQLVPLPFVCTCSALTLCRSRSWDMITSRRAPVCEFFSWVLTLSSASCMNKR